MATTETDASATIGTQAAGSIIRVISTRANLGGLIRVPAIGKRVTVS